MGGGVGSARLSSFLCGGSGGSSTCTGSAMPSFSSSLSAVKGSRILWVDIFLYYNG